MNLRAEISPPKLWIDIKVQTPEGVILQELSEEGHSWVRNFYIMHSLHMIDSAGVSSLLLQTTEGVLVQGELLFYSGRGSGYSYLGGIGKNMGPILGTSNEPFHIADYRLYDRIPHGNGSGQLYRQAGFGSYEYNAINESIQTKLTKVFNNNSEGTLVIREAGLYGSFSVAGNLTTFAMARDVLSGAVTAPHGTLVTVTYTLTTPSLNYLRPLPAIGTKGMGGYYAGQIWGITELHKKYGYIVAPIAGEGTVPCQISTGATGFIDEYMGINNTLNYISMGASSPMGVFCDDIRNASPPLGGYNDWYIPSNMEMQMLFPRVRGSLSPADSFASTDYFSSTENSQSYQKGGNPMTSSWRTDLSKITPFKVRLIRRILVDDFIPDVVTP